PRDAHHGSPGGKPELCRRRDHRRGRRPDAVLRPGGGATRSLFDAESARVPLLRIDAAGGRRPRHVRLLRGAKRAAKPRPATRRSPSARGPEVLIVLLREALFLEGVANARPGSDAL